MIPSFISDIYYQTYVDNLNKALANYSEYKVYSLGKFFQNQDSPIAENLTPIIGIDVCERAYYLQYKNNRSSYIDNWMNVIN